MNIKEKIKNSKEEGEILRKNLVILGKNKKLKNIIRTKDKICPLHNTKLKIKILITKTAIGRKYNWGGFTETIIGYTPKNSFWILGCPKCSYANYE